MRYVGGDLQARFMDRVRGVDPQRCLAVPQVQGHLDLVFPGLSACFDGILGTKAGAVIVRDLADPDRMRRLGVEGLRRFVERRGVVLQRRKAQR